VDLVGLLREQDGLDAFEQVFHQRLLAVRNVDDAVAVFVEHALPPWFSRVPRSG